MSKPIEFKGRIEAIGDIDYVDGGTCRGVLIRMHADELRELAKAGFLFKDIRFAIASSEPGEV